jgi:predicted transcriptional regulator
MKQSGTVSAHLDEWTLAQVQAYAKAEDRSVSWVVGFALKQFFVSRGGHVTLLEPSARSRQVHLEDAIAAAVKAGPLEAKRVQVRKNLAARKERLDARMAKHK